jgi:hypothetical protein
MSAREIVLSAPLSQRQPGPIRENIVISNRNSETSSCLEPCSFGAFIIKQCFGTCNFPWGGTNIIGQNIETRFTVAQCRSDHRQHLVNVISARCSFCTWTITTERGPIYP